MSLNLVVLLYLVASVCFIQALKGLSHPTTSIRGNVFGMTGMAIAVLTTAALIVQLASDGGVGMVYVLEGTSVAMASHGASAVQTTLGLPETAFSYLTSHGALDQDHMRFFAGLMNSIEDSADQEAILTMARNMFRLFAGMFAAIPMEALDEAA